LESLRTRRFGNAGGVVFMDEPAEEIPALLAIRRFSA